VLILLVHVAAAFIQLLHCSWLHIIVKCSCCTVLDCTLSTNAAAALFLAACYPQCSNVLGSINNGHKPESIMKSFLLLAIICRQCCCSQAGQVCGMLPIPMCGAWQQQQEEEGEAGFQEAQVNQSLAKPQIGCRLSGLTARSTHAA
jgi:hypothetical protein